jgi:hypothetical protein
MNSPDMVKLAKLNTNFGVPAMYRIIVWKLLLGMPCLRKPWWIIQTRPGRGFVWSLKP